MKKWFLEATVFIAVTVIMLLAGEWVVRLLYADQTVLFPRYHTDARYGDYTLRRIRPNSRFTHTSVDGSWEFVTNSLGFRNVEDFSYDKPQGVLRILSLGDSHTQGYEVRQTQTYSAILERYLSKHGVSAQVINTGVSGFSTAEGLVLLENELLQYAPDYVVLGFFANDLEDNIKTGLFELDSSGALVATGKSHIPGVKVQNLIYSIPGIKWLSENSYFYSLLFNSTWELFKRRLSKQAKEKNQEFAVSQKSVYSNYEIELAAALLQRIHELCIRNGIDFILVDIPQATGNEFSSIPDTLRPVAQGSSDVFIDSNRLIDSYVGVAELHVPHGHRHISELSHTLIGIEVGRQILALRADKAASKVME